MLNRPDGGNCVALVVGGAPESLFSRRGNVIELFLQKRFEIDSMNVTRQRNSDINILFLDMVS